MIAIYKRELRSYFNNVTGCLFIAINLLFSGIYFSVYHLFYGYPYVAYTISSILFVLLVATPVLTMKSLAEEKSLKTDQLLFTSPVSAIGIILGKYFAMLTIFAIPVAMICIYPLILSAFGTVAIAESYVAVLGYFLFGALCIALGMLVSSLTENLIISAICTFALLMAGYLMKGLCSIISSDGNFITRILLDFDTLSRMNNMVQGSLDVSSVVYFITMISLVIFLVYRVVQKRRYTLNKENVKHTLLSTTSIVVALAIVFALNYVTTLIPEEYQRIDVTKEGIYGISDQTKELLSTLDEDINIYVLSDGSSFDTTIQKIVNRYADLSSHIKLSYIDTNKNPEFANKYDAGDATSGSIIVENSKRYKLVDYNSLYVSEMNYETYTTEVTALDAEGQISSAIAYVRSDDLSKLYVISGHDEASVSSSLKSLISKGNVSIEEINLMNYDKVPDDASAIIIISPTIDYSTDDVKKITDYIDGGGKAVMFSSYNKETLDNYDGIVKKYGLNLLDGMIIENDKDHYYQNPYFILPNIASSAASNDLINKKQYVLMPYARPVTFDESGEGEWSYSKVLYSSDDSFAKKNVSNADSYEKEDGDVDGPFSLGVYLNNMNTGAEIYYYSSESLLNDNVDSMVSYANSQMVANGLLSMINSDQTPLITIPEKKYQLSSITVSQSKMAILSILFILVLPFAIFVTGLIIWMNRRKR